MNPPFYRFPLAEIRTETPTACSLIFHIPAEHKEIFEYNHGQFVTLKFDIKGQEYRRSYSMSSSPIEDTLTITVKKVKGGVVSKYIHEQLKAGDFVELMTPDGLFFTELDEAVQKTYYLFAAGSGITPIMSILKTTLEHEPKSSVYLLYGNRNESEIIFRDVLDTLARKYEGQFTVEYILSQPEGGKSTFGFLKKSAPLWLGRKGRINANEVSRFIQDNPQRGKVGEFFICGPNEMIDTVQETLLNAGTPQAHIHSERFASFVTNAAPAKISQATLIVHLNGERIETTMSPKKKILERLLDLKKNPPYSCASGACSTCMAKLIQGQVTMDACFALDEAEIAKGFILTCQSHPITEIVEIEY
ncbi:MAG: ferredoxin--NADP reductase [Saprospiraceae bacterium]